MLPDMTIVNVNPGLCRTNLGREFDFSPSPRLIYEIIWFLSTSRSAEKGARNLSHAVANSEESVDVRTYFTDIGVELMNFPVLE